MISLMLDHHLKMVEQKYLDSSAQLQLLITRLSSSDADATYSWRAVGDRIMSTLPIVQIKPSVQHGDYVRSLYNVFSNRRDIEGHTGSIQVFAKELAIYLMIDGICYHVRYDHPYTIPEPAREHTRMICKHIIEYHKKNHCDV